MVEPIKFDWDQTRSGPGPSNGGCATTRTISRAASTRPHVAHGATTSATTTMEHRSHHHRQKGASLCPRARTMSFRSLPKASFAARSSCHGGCGITLDVDPREAPCGAMPATRTSTRSNRSNLQAALRGGFLVARPGSGQVRSGRRRGRQRPCEMGAKAAKFAQTSQNPQEIAMLVGSIYPAIHCDCHQ